MVFRPTRYFSIISAIETVFNLNQDSSDTVTWSTSASQTVQENTEKNITLSASSSAGGTISYSKIGGADQALFSLAGSTLTLSAKNYESPIDSDSNNTYIVQVRATSTAGATADLTITVTVSNVNEAPNFSLTGAYVSGNTVSYTNDDIGTQEDIVFGNLEPQYLTITNPESSENITLTLTISGGASLTLGSTSGLTFNTGDGTNDTTLEFVGSLSNINNAIEGLQVITPASTGTYTLQLTIYDGNTTGPSNISIVRANPLAETQLVTFNNVPTGGSWKLGVTSAAGEYVEFLYSDTASYIQSSLRASSSVTAAWGTDLTVTGNYTIGFTVTASKRGNLDVLYFDDSSLTYPTSVTQYAYGGDGWDGMINLAGIDASYATTEISPNDTSAVFHAQFDFTDFPEVVPDGIEVTLYRGNNYIRDNNIYLSNSGSPIGNDLSTLATWSAGIEPAQFGSSSNLWGVSMSAGDWATTLNNGNIGIRLTAYNTDGAYNQNAVIDAVSMKVYYGLGVTMNISTIQNGT